MKTHVLTLRCQNKNCLTISRIGRYQYSTVIGQFKYCPMCGGEAWQLSDGDRDYWEILAEAYSLTPEIVKEAFSIWNTQETNKFSEFIDNLKQEAGL